MELFTIFYQRQELYWKKSHFYNKKNITNPTKTKPFFNIRFYRQESLRERERERESDGIENINIPWHR